MMLTKIIIIFGLFSCITIIFVQFFIWEPLFKEDRKRVWRNRLQTLVMTSIIVWSAIDFVYCHGGRK